MFSKSTKLDKEDPDVKVGSFESKNANMKKGLLVAVLVALIGVGFLLVTRGIKAEAGWTALYNPSTDIHSTELVCKGNLNNQSILRIKYTGDNSSVSNLTTVFGPSYGWPYVQKVSKNVANYTWSGYYRIPQGSTVVMSGLFTDTGLNDPKTIHDERIKKLSDIETCITTTPPPPPPATCPIGQTGTPPNCVSPPPETCPVGQTGTPPNCVTPPSSGGYPDASNTGVPAGTTLRPMSSLNITDGTVIDGADITGNFTVRANNVTIKNSRIRGNGYWVVKFAEGYSNLTIQNTEITRLNSCNSATDISCFADYGIMSDGANLNLSKVNIHNVTTGIHLGSNATIQDSYIWGTVNISGKDHNDAILTNGGSRNLVFRHNSLEVPATQTSPIALYDDAYAGGASDGVTVDNNLINGGGFCIYMGPSNRNIHVTNNRFGQKFYPKCGYFGVSHDNLPTTTGNSWVNNVWNDTGAVIAAP